MEDDDNITGSQLDLSQKEAFIASYPLFGLLNKEDIHELATLMYQINIDPGTVICSQGDILYKFYLIVSGTAEASRTHTTIEATKTIQLDTLSTGNSIGLSESGFGARTGIQVSTYTAATPMTLLVADLRKFLEFLTAPTRKYPGLKNAAEQLMLMSFISKTNFFRHINNSQIHTLSKKITKISVPAQTVIFKEGDDAESCYFILHGEAEAYSINSSGQKHVLKTLQHGMLFGEAALLLQGKRNASVVTVTPCELFELKRNILLETIEFKPSMLHKVLDKRIKEVRPLQFKSIQAKKQVTEQGKVEFILENNETGKKLVLTENEYSLWLLLDGTNTLHDLTNKAQKDLGLFTPEEFRHWIKMLVKEGYIAGNPLLETYQPKSSGFRGVLHQFMRFLKLKD